MNASSVLAFRPRVNFSDISMEQLGEEVKKLRDEHGVTFAEIERKSGISRTSISQLANHKKANDTVEQRMREFLEEFYAGDSGEAVPEVTEYKQQIELFPTSEFNEVMGFIEDMRIRRKMGVVIGHPGSGKTTIVKEYVKRTPGAVYIEAFDGMKMNDLLEVIAGACGTALCKGSSYKKVQHIINVLKDKEIMLLIDEAEYLKKWDVSKFETLRKIWDNTGTPIILCGTYILEEYLTRGNGKDNLAQLYRRKYEVRLHGIKEKEVREILRHYNISREAADILVSIAIDVKHGGMGNFVELLELCLEAAEGGQIDKNIVREQTNYKMLY